MIADGSGAQLSLSHNMVSINGEWKRFFNCFILAELHVCVIHTESHWLPLLKCFMTRQYAFVRFPTLKSPMNCIIWLLFMWNELHIAIVWGIWISYSWLPLLCRAYENYSPENSRTENSCSPRFYKIYHLTIS